VLAVIQFSPQGDNENVYQERNTIMRTAGIIFFTMDLLKTLYTGYTNVSKENEEDMAELKKKKHNQRPLNWQPYAGIGMMVIGGAFLVLGRKKSLPA